MDLDTRPTRRPRRRNGLGIIIAVAAVLVIAIVLLVVALVRDDDDDETDIRQSGDLPANPIPGVVLDLSIGRIVAASAIDQNSCAAEVPDTFAPDDTLYLVAEASDIPSGTVVSARLTQDDATVAQAPQNTSATGYEDTCMSFQLVSEDDTFAPGTYQAELLVDGAPSGAVDVTIE